MEPFTQDAVTILAGAMGHARRLGHRYIGGEHLLLALVSTGPAGGRCPARLRPLTAAR